MMPWDQTTLWAFCAGGFVAVAAPWSAVLLKWVAKKLGVMP